MIIICAVEIQYKVSGLEFDNEFLIRLGSSISQVRITLFTILAISVLLVQLAELVV